MSIKKTIDPLDQQPFRDFKRSLEDDRKVMDEMLVSIQAWEPRCTRTVEQLIAIISHCQMCMHYDPGYGCSNKQSGDQGVHRRWEHWRNRLVYAVCDHWPQGIV
ncbi:MAG: hypothetical protein ABSA77_03585 [Thermoguttaceae bacterium]